MNTGGILITHVKWPSECKGSIGWHTIDRHMHSGIEMKDYEGLFNAVILVWRNTKQYSTPTKLPEF